MSKTVKRKITVELPKPRDLSKNRLSVFQRLGTKKLKIVDANIDKAKDDNKQQLPVASSKIIDNKQEPVELEDADPDILERKRAELQKELELQLKMETARKTTKDIVRKRKKVRSSSSSSSSSSDSSSSDSSSSSSSKESKRKIRKTKGKRRNSSSSSDEPRVKKVAKVKRVCHKKIDANKLHKSAHAKKLLAQSGKVRKRSQSPVARKRAPGASPVRTHKLQPKTKLPTDVVAKHHRVKEVSREGDKDREFAHRDRDRERDREKEREKERLRSRDKERGRSRTPKLRGKSRTPKRVSRSRDVKHKSPLRRVTSPKSRSGGSVRRDRSLERNIVKKDLKRHESSRERERERREKERQDREAAKEKERQVILARCQERQRERERIAREKTRRSERDRDEERPKGDRLLPRPAERAMALAAARERSREKSMERDRPRSHSHTGRDRIDRDKDHIPYDRGFEREDPRYDISDRRMEKDDRGVRDERERDYLVVRRREDIRNDHMDGPYMGRDKRVDRDEMERDMYLGGGSDQRYDDHMRDDRRGGHEYQSRGYVDDRHRSEREREWTRENEMVREPDRNLMYDRPPDRHPVRDWDRGEMTPNHSIVNRENYNEQREWNAMNERQWEGGGGVNTTATGNWPQEEEAENWDNVEDKEWQEYHRIQEKMRHETGSGNNRRWTNWRGRRGNQHHGGDFRRHNIHGQQDGFANRGDMSYNRRLQHPESESQVTAAVNVDFSHAVPVARPQQIITPKLEVVASPIKSVHNEVIVEEKDESAAAPKEAPTEDFIDEPIADDLSEISDDADEILNRQEELLEKSNEPETPEVEDPPKESEETEDAPTTDSTMPTEVKTDLNESKDIPEEMDLDFEEISDGELEEEARIRGLGDALGVDWASLVEESKAIAKEKSIERDTTAKQRWQPHRIFLDVGISLKMGGTEFATKILTDAHQKLEEEIQKQQEISVKTESVDIDIKKEPNNKEYIDSKENMDIKSLKTEIKPEFDFHPIACIQVAQRLNAEKRKNLVFNATGPYSRALSFKRDLEMRRQLCGLPIKPISCNAVSKKPESEYKSIALQLFQKAIAEAH